MRNLISHGIVLTICAVSLANAGGQKSPRDKALVAYLSEVGAAAYFYGACERYIPNPEEGLRALTGADIKDKNADQREFAGILSDMYARGRSEAASLGYDANQCTTSIRQSLDAVDQRKRELDALP